MTKAVLERALAEEMTHHLGYEKHDPAGRGSGNSRNGSSGKRLLTEVGRVDLAVPRDRSGMFAPQIVRNRGVYPVVFIDALMVKIRDGWSPTGPSIWPSASTATAPRTC